MHKIDAPKRAFYLNHQKFVLDIDIKGRTLRGFTELHIIPTTNSLSHVRINARHCDIHNVTVNGIATSHEYIDIIKNSLLPEVTKDKNIFQYHELKRSYHTALYEAEEGELLIHIPEVIDIVQFQENEAPLLDDSNEAYNAMFEGRVMFTPLVIRIDFAVVNPKAGVNFILPDPQVNPYRFPHVYTCNETFPGQVRLWLPCIDRMHERCTWEMEYIVDQTLQDSSGDNVTEEEEALEMVVVSSGELIEQTSHPIEPTKKIFHYILAIPSPAFSISFAAGPFEVVKLSSSDGQVEKSSEDAGGKSTSEIFMNTDDSEGTSGMFAFCLPGWIDETANSCEFLNKALEFYAQELGSYPYSSFKLVFVEDAPDIMMYSATMTIASTHLLHGDDIIDQTYETRRHLSLALAKQWFGIHVVPKYGADLWLTVGLANYATSLLIKHLHGNNEYRFRMKKDIDKVCELDVDRPPLYNVNLAYPVDPDDYNFMQLKAPLVLFVLGKRMMKGGPSLGIHRAIPKVLVAAMSGELGSGNALSTNWFLKVCRKVSGVDNKPFAEQWIYPFCVF
ncbi:hypothetical protein K7432_001433 [Basidiobolus ranarum]|uniref:Transcription initiation factor TFIID subunit 2 n=1 Tax=Basidiobolus ranarum TaxID=34480 RepID=A0ABR2W9M7_9FUNG